MEMRGEAPTLRAYSSTRKLRELARVPLLDGYGRPHMRMPGAVERGDDDRRRAFPGVPDDVVEVHEIFLGQSNACRSRTKTPSFGKFPRGDEEAQSGANGRHEPLELRRNPDNSIDRI